MFRSKSMDGWMGMKKMRGRYDFACFLVAFSTLSEQGHSLLVNRLGFQGICPRYVCKQAKAAFSFLVFYGNMSRA